MVCLMPKRPSRPEPNLTPFSIVGQVTGPPFAHSLDIAAVRQKLMQEMGRRDGSKGGKARAESLDKKARSEIARKAAKARWNKAKL